MFPNINVSAMTDVMTCLLLVQHPVVGFDGCLVTTPPPPAAAAASISPAFVLSPYGTLTERLHVCPEFHRGQCSVELCPFAHPGMFK